MIMTSIQRRARISRWRIIGRRSERRQIDGGVAVVAYDIGSNINLQMTQCQWRKAYESVNQAKK